MIMLSVWLFVVSSHKRCTWKTCRWKRCCPRYHRWGTYLHLPRCLLIGTDDAVSGAGTNLKVEEGHSKSGGTSPTWSAGKKIFRARPLFLALKVKLVALVSAFVMVSTVWSVSCLMFFYSRCPRAQPFVKVGAPLDAMLYDNSCPVMIVRLRFVNCVITD